MINLDDVTNENIKEHNPNWQQVPDHSYRISIIGGTGFGKTNLLFSLIIHQPDINKTRYYLYAKDLFKSKYHFLINKQESTGLKHLHDFKTCNGNSNDMDDIYKNIEEYNPNKKCKVLIIFDDMIADMVYNNMLNNDKLKMLYT